MKVIKVLSYIFNGGILNTLKLNFSQLPVSQAIKIPIIVYNHTKILNLKKGKIIIEAPVKFGMIKIGPYSLGFCDPKYDRTIWNNSGEAIFKGQALIGQGCKIGIGKDAKIEFGQNFCITGLSTLLSQKSIKFGNDCLLSWGIMMMDTDWHSVKSNNEEIINTKEIVIGKHVWIASDCTILKGVNISDNTVIAANTLVTTNLSSQNSIYGNSNNLKIIRSDIHWIR